MLILFGMTIIHAPPEVRLMRKRLIDLLLSRRAWIGLALVLGGLEAWGTRHWLNPDGLSYLDIAANAAAHGPHQLINGLWSPGYPAVLAVALWIVQPGPASDVPTVHAVNFLIYALALWSFTILLRELMAQSGTDGNTMQDRAGRYLVPIGYTCFIALICATGAGPNTVTPDSAAAAALFLAAYSWLRLRADASALRWGLLMGVSLATSYYLKAAMFPLSLAFLIGCFYLSGPLMMSRRAVVASIVTFFVLSAPLAYLVSTRLGRPTFSDAGRLNYAWRVNDVPPPWSDDMARLPASLTHPPRQLLERPLTIEFAEPDPRHLSDLV